jgi:nicotinate-nucleotide pyrophosphorylase (carboxylating)
VAAPDLRDALFAPLAGRTFRFEMAATEAGVVAGTTRLAERAAVLGVSLAWVAPEGALLAPGDRVCVGSGDAWQLARAEEDLLGLVAKASGVATAAAEFVLAARGARIVCGAWKKVAPEVRAALRDAIRTGGAGMRILERPFVYLDKNAVRMFGGVAPAVRQARRIGGRAVVVQLRGEHGLTVGEEAEAACIEGAEVLFVDTGDLVDLAVVARSRREGRLPPGVEIGFGGGVTRENVRAAVEAGADVVDVGRAIIDAQLLDLRLDLR